MRKIGTLTWKPFCNK